MTDHIQDPVTYISDCRDDNTRGRLIARVSTLFKGSNVVFVGVKNDYEAAINLVDIVDAYEGRPGVIMANVARREGESKKRWPNGTPFGWFKLDNLDVFTTIDGYILSLLQKVMKTPLTVNIYDIPSVVPKMDISAEKQERIINTQFRSFDYLPRLAHALSTGADLPTTDHFDEVPLMPASVCWVDSFGNVKTNFLPEEIDFQVGEKRVVRIGNNKQLYLPCYERLKDIPDGEAAFTVGSSGYKDKRFIEIMVQGGSAAQQLGLRSGDSFEYVGVK